MFFLFISFLKMKFDDIDFFLILVYFAIFFISLFLCFLTGDLLFIKKIDKSLYEELMISIFSFSVIVAIISFIGMIIIPYSNFAGKFVINFFISIFSLFILILPLFIIYEIFEQNMLAPSTRQLIEIVQIIVSFSGFVIFCSTLPIYLLTYNDRKKITI